MKSGIQPSAVFFAEDRIRVQCAGACAGMLLLCAVFFPVQAEEQPKLVLMDSQAQYLHPLVSPGNGEIRVPDGSSWEVMKKARDEHDRQRFKVLRTEPGLGPRLVKQAESDLADPNFSSYLPDLFHAMTLRKDVDAKAIRSFIQRARVVIESPPKELPTPEYYLVLGIPELLTLHATPENEDILIKLMKLGETTRNFYFLSKAAEALAKTGSARCLPALEEALQWLQQRPKDRVSKEAIAPLQSCLLKVRARMTRAGGRGV